MPPMWLTRRSPSSRRSTSITKRSSAPASNRLRPKKPGIIKAGRPAVFSAQRPAAFGVLEHRALEMEAPGDAFFGVARRRSASRKIRQPVHAGGATKRFRFIARWRASIRWRMRAPRSLRSMFSACRPRRSAKESRAHHGPGGSNASRPIPTSFWTARTIPPAPARSRHTSGNSSRTSRCVSSMARCATKRSTK